MTGSPNFRLIYTSVETYEQSNCFAIVGKNPAGTSFDADYDAPTIDRGFKEEGYSAYLDDAWHHSVGQHPFQRAVQGIAMIVAGASPLETMAAITDESLEPEERIGAEATAFLRTTPSLNMIPYRDSNADNLGDLLSHGEKVGWKLLRLIHPKPRCIITLANGKSQPPWSTILHRSRQREPKEDCCVPINKRGKRYYREVVLRSGPLKGVLLIGLPAIVRDRIRKEGDTLKVFEVLSRRLRHHDLILG